MLSVAVIDSNTVSRNLLTSVLINGGHNIVGGSNTSSAGLASMIKLKPQLVCIDIGEANEAGLQMLDTLRNGLPKALIFLVSSQIDSDTVQLALARGVHGFIVKPFNSITVLANIRNTIIKVAKQHTRAKNGADDSVA
jgi:DNA-binding NtrC family response regulator